MNSLLKMKHMIRSFLLTILVICSSIAVGQDNSQLLFDRANDALQNGDIMQALNTYKGLEEGSSVSGALFLNMGISYVELDSLGKAKYYFLKASRFEETEASAEQGLAYVEQRFSRQSAILPKLPWDIAVDWLRVNVGASVILGLGIILLNFGVIALVSTWFGAPFPKQLRLSGLSAAGVGIIIILLSFYVQYVSNRYSEAVMVHRQTNVVEQPSDESAIVSQAYEGYTFTVDEYRSNQESGWSYIRMSNGLYGWIPNNEIMVL